MKIGGSLRRQRTKMASKETEETALYSRKLRRAAQMIFFQRHRHPGVKGWELRKALGKDYMKVIDLLSIELDKLGFQVKILFEEGELKNPTEEQRDKARFLTTLKHPVASPEAVTAGWRIDDIAMLAAATAYIISRQGRTPRREVERVLREKFPIWRVDLNLERFIRRGYLAQDEDGVLSLDWRARAEIDQKALMNLILGVERISL
jgi:hypothetical protein